MTLNVLCQAKHSSIRLLREVALCQLEFQVHLQSKACLDASYVYK